MAELVTLLLIFVAVGVGFLAVNMFVGKLIRPHRPSEEKQTIYECGEPTIGSSWIQFDLRFYVVALLFVTSTSKWRSSSLGRSCSAMPTSSPPMT